MSRMPLGHGLSLMREALTPPHIPEQPSLPPDAPVEPVSEYERELERERAEKAAWRATAFVLFIVLLLLGL